MRVLVRLAPAAVLAIANVAAAQDAVIIRSLESSIVFHTRFDPKEITITKSAPWRRPWPYGS